MDYPAKKFQFFSVSAIKMISWNIYHALEDFSEDEALYAVNKAELHKKEHFIAMFFFSFNNWVEWVLMLLISEANMTPSMLPIINIIWSTSPSRPTLTLLTWVRLSTIGIRLVMTSTKDNIIRIANKNQYQIISKWKE